jgi:nucleoside-diphosphate-sugar epimerase
MPHYRVFGVVRSTNAANTLREVGVIPIIADLDNRASLSRLAGIADIVIHLAPPPATGTTDPRTRNLLALLAQQPLAQLIYISTSGVYGDCQGAYIDETHTPRPVNRRALCRVDAEQQIRRFAQHARTQVATLRVPGIYAENRLPLERLRRGTPILRDVDDVYTNHIHADDLARIIVAAVYRSRNARTYHANDDSELKMGAYFQQIATAYQLPIPAAISRALAQSTLSEIQMSFMSESRRMRNQRIKTELRVRLSYPTVGDFVGG